MSDADIWLDTPEEFHAQMLGDIERYTAAMHAVQSGVVFEINGGGEAHEPKHLRVGINSAMVQNGALVTLLVEKGILTWPEWFTALADAAEMEKESYEERSGVKFA